MLRSDKYEQKYHVNVDFQHKNANENEYTKMSVKKCLKIIYTNNNAKKAIAIESLIDGMNDKDNSLTFPL